MEVFQGGKDGKTRHVFQFPKNAFRNVLIGIVVIIAVSAAWSSFYTVQEQEQAAILTFGKYSHTEERAGLHFKLPYPFQDVIVYPAKLTQQIQIGYREGPNGTITVVEEEALMITGDENIVSADAVVEWRVSDLRNFLFNIDDPEQFLRNTAISSIRSVIGSTKLDYAITEGKTVIQAEARERLEELQQQYNTGIQIIDLKFQDIEPPEGEVQAAFRDVTNAREEKNTKINQAQKYVNDVLPKARGEAQALLENAEAVKKSRILNAEGEVAQFNALYEEYAKQPNITESRLILETLEKILPNAKIIVTDGSSETVNYLPLTELMRSSAGTGSNTGTSTGANQGGGSGQ